MNFYKIIINKADNIKIKISLQYSLKLKKLIFNFLKLKIFKKER